MNRTIVREFHRAFADELFVIGADVSHLLNPRAFPFRTKVELHFFDLVDHLAEYELGVADDADFRRDVPTDALRCGVDLYIGRFIAPRGWFAELLATPVSEANRQYVVCLTS